MAPARKRRKSTTRKRAAPRKRQTKIEKEPAYMVQLSDPKMVRKDLLESLREIIIFMQGYEQFRRIQEEKVAHIAALRADLKEIQALVNVKLRKYLPQGKLTAVSGKEPQQPELVAAPEEQNPDLGIGVAVVDEVKEVRPTVAAAPVDFAPKSELDELESQLQDIESQLRDIK